MSPFQRLLAEVARAGKKLPLKGTASGSGYLIQYSQALFRLAEKPAAGAAVFKMAHLPNPYMQFALMSGAGPDALHPARVLALASLKPSDDYDTVKKKLLVAMQSSMAEASKVVPASGRAFLQSAWSPDETFKYKG